MTMQKCPKCQSSDIDAGKVMSAGGVSYKSDIHKVIFDTNTTARACLDCGYVEIYVNRDYRDKIKEKRADKSE